MSKEQHKMHSCRVGRALAVILVAAAFLMGRPSLADEESAPTVIVVVGAPGTPQYEQEFDGWARHWKEAAAQGGANYLLIGKNQSTAEPLSGDRELLRAALKDAAAIDDQELWIILIGHGTFDRRTARFNLRGPDVSASELVDWLKPIQRPLALVNCASASGPFVNKLSAANRAIVTATKSGSEQNFARFGKYLSAGIADPQADLDKDGQTSLLEAWLRASRQVDEFYKTEGRLATEHSLLEDNGDGRAVRADFFRGIRPIKKSADNGAIDGYRAHQFHLVRSPQEHRLPTELRKRRDELELAVVVLRDSKETLQPDEYLVKLEALLVELAELYERVESTQDTIVPVSGERSK